MKKVDISDTQKFTLSVTANGIRGSGESFGGYFHAGGVPARPAPEPRPSSVPVTPAPRVPRPPHVCLVRLLRTQDLQSCRCIAPISASARKRVPDRCLLATCFSALLSYLFDSLYFLSLSVLSIFRIVELFSFFFVFCFGLLPTSGRFLRSLAGFLGLEQSLRSFTEASFLRKKFLLLVASIFFLPLDLAYTH